MYREIEPALRMTANEASACYPNEFIIMQMDSMDLDDDIGVVLYAGDSRVELYGVIKGLNVPYISVVEGLNHQRNCLGGIVANG